MSSSEGRMSLKEGMKTKRQIKKALEDLAQGNFESIEKALQTVCGHSRWNPNWVGKGFELALHWVLEEPVKEEP